MPFSGLNPQLARRVLTEAGIVPEGVRATGGFGSGLRRIAADVAPIVQFVAPVVGSLIKQVTGDFPPGEPPGRLPQVPPKTDAQRLGQGAVLLSAADQQRILTALEVAAARSRAVEAVQRVELPRERLISSEAGGVGLQKFIAPLRREPMATDISPSIQPCQEMLEYQWEVFGARGEQNLLANERALFDLLVPAGETWEILGVTIAGDVATRYTMIIVQPGFDTDHRVCAININANDVKQMLYTVDGQKGATGGSLLQDFIGWGEPLSVYGTETLRVFTQDIPAGGTPTCAVRYRRRPKEKSLGVSPVAMVTTAV